LAVKILKELAYIEDPGPAGHSSMQNTFLLLAKSIDCMENLNF
jgi:hypothetical protein